MNTQALNTTIQNIIKDTKVTLLSEFDKNFTRQAFFTDKWQRKKSPSNNKTILINSGKLRQSITAKQTPTTITFQSVLPYAAIHNEGGEIAVTQKMKAFFWYKYYQTTKKLKWKKNKQLSQTKQNINVSTIAEFYKAMALQKIGRKIKIPKRQFIGQHPQLEKIVTTIINNELNKYINNINITKP